MSRKNKKHPLTPPTHEEIAACAYEIYQHEGCVPGREMEHWLQAEAQLLAQRQQHNGQSPQQPRRAKEVVRAAEEAVRQPAQLTAA